MGEDQPDPHYKLGIRKMGKKKKRINHRKEAGNTVNTIIGVAWYSREQWNRLLEMSSDHDNLEDTYDKLLEMAEKQLTMLTHQGYVIRKVGIDVEELLSWCNSKSKSVDGEARSEFTLIKLQELDKVCKSGSCL